MSNVVQFTRAFRPIPQDAANFAPHPATATVKTLDHFGPIPLNAAWHYAPAALKDALVGAADKHTLLITSAALASKGSTVESATLAWLAGYTNASVMDVLRFLKSGEHHFNQVVELVKKGSDLDATAEATCRRVEAHLYCALQMLPDGAKPTLRAALENASGAAIADRPQRVITAFQEARRLARAQ